IVIIGEERGNKDVEERVGGGRLGKEGELFKLAMIHESSTSSKEGDLNGRALADTAGHTGDAGEFPLKLYCSSDYGARLAETWMSGRVESNANGDICGIGSAESEEQRGDESPWTPGGTHSLGMLSMETPWLLVQRTGARPPSGSPERPEGSMERPRVYK
ncbi:hypothetical protein KUCAC02_023113, partial [Chaenocephalus aceratus]